MAGRIVVGVLVKLSLCFLSGRGNKETQGRFQTASLCYRVEITPAGEKAKFHKLVIYQTKDPVNSASSCVSFLYGLYPPIPPTTLWFSGCLPWGVEDGGISDDVKRLCLGWTDALWLLEGLLIEHDDSGTFISWCAE